jgi:alpha-galactosidase
MGKRIAIVGGGSSMFVPLLLRKLIGSDVLRGSIVVLMDVDAHRLEVMDTLGRRLVEREGADLKIESTTNQRDALTGADFVIVAIAVGGNAAWEQDIEIPAKYGVFMHVHDSIGPGGIMRAFRHAPIMRRICEDLRAVSPHAWVFNYTNPAAALTMVMHTVPQIRAVSLCSCSAYTTNVDLLAAWAGVAPDQLAMPPTVAGLNHCAAILDLRLKDGRSALPLMRSRTAEDLTAYVREHYDAPSDRAARFADSIGMHEPVTNWFYDQYGVLPYCWTHWIEFYPALQRLRQQYTGRAQGLDIKYGRKMYDMAEQRQRARKWQDLAERWSRPEHASEVSLANLPHGEQDQGIEVVEIIEGIAANGNRVHTVNTTNSGAIENLPSEAIVEVNALVNSYGIQPIQVGRLPEPIAAFLRLHISVQQLTAQAGLSGDRRTALHAFLLDPLIASMLQIEETERMLDEMLLANACYLPQFA